jgi:hypothetical protein
VTNGETPEHPSMGGLLVEPDAPAPIGEHLAASELGVAAQSARVALDAALERLTHELATPWPTWKD